MELEGKTLNTKHCHCAAALLCKIKPIHTGRRSNTFSSTGLLGNDLSDITATLCLIHWLRYLIMFWYSTHLISMSCGDGKGFQQRSIEQSQRVTKPSLTLGLIPSAPSGTFGKASYSVETYVMTDFSSGDWTSTSVEGSRGRKRSLKLKKILMNQDKGGPAHPLGPGVGALPAARPHKKRAPD